MSHIETVIVNKRSYELIFDKDEQGVTVDVLGYESLGLKGRVHKFKRISEVVNDYAKLIAFYDDLEIMERDVPAVLKGVAFLTGVALATVVLN